MKRIWFTQQQKLYCNYLPLRWGLGQYTDTQIDTLSGLFKPDAPDNPRKLYCPKIYTTRTHPLSGEYIVVEGSRFKAKPVEPRIEFKVNYPIRMKLELRTGLIHYEGEFAIGSVHSDKMGGSGYMFEGEQPKDYTFAELDLGIKGATFEQLRDELLRLNKKATIDTPFYVNKLEPINRNWRITEKGNISPQEGTAHIG